MKMKMKMEDGRREKRGGQGQSSGVLGTFQLGVSH